MVGVDNLNTAYDVRLKQWRLNQLHNRQRFEFYQADVRDQNSLRSIVRPGLGAIVNLAAAAGVRQSIEQPALYTETNITGTLNLLELAREYNIKKFILASTSSLYGANNRRPFREDADTSAPLSPYAASKRAAKVPAYTCHHLFGIDISVLRFFTVYGPARGEGPTWRSFALCRGFAKTAR